MHASAVAQAVTRLDSTIGVHIFEVDSLSSFTGAFFLGSKRSDVAYLHDSYNRQVELASLTVVWWRRSTFPQQNDAGGLTDDDVALINRDSQSFIEALFTLHFSGGWVNYPWHARRAENKALQLLVAREEGIRVPQTVVTNDPVEVQKLLRSANPFVVKSLAGLPGTSILTQKLTPELAMNEMSIRVSPACYQRYVSGDQHARLLVFGSECIGVIISSVAIDSRIDFSSPPKPFDAPEEIKNILHRILLRLNLAMGVFDIKLNENGVPFFLEVNQQGQFLYLDAMTGTGLVEKFAAFLIREAIQPDFSMQYQ